MIRSLSSAVDPAGNAGIDSGVDATPYYQLNPDRVMDAVESLGFYCDGRVMALNSYENRVFQVGLDDAQPLIAKFYRPSRWSDAQILEEHQFTLELADRGVNAIAPIQHNGESLFRFSDFRFSLFPRKGGHAPELDNEDHLFELGRFLGKMHSIGEIKPFQYRPELNVTDYARVGQQHVLNSGLLGGYRQRYERLTEELLKVCEQRLKQVSAPLIRVQGDCHGGNMLWRDDELMLLDFDDCRMGMAVQDLWLHVSDSDAKQQQLSELIEGYESHHSFDTRELDLIDVFMAERHIAYSAWIAERWADPAFPTIFPHFTGEDFWRQHVGDLEEMVRQWGKWR